MSELPCIGLRENLAQFSLLAAINAFVGAMVGLERSTLPLIGRARSAQPFSVSARFLSVGSTGLPCAAVSTKNFAAYLRSATSAFDVSTVLRAGREPLPELPARASVRTS
ncbi:MAG: hypothetical protein ACYCXW_10545 [Solirubrobacteraceae bacterium]